MRRHQSQASKRAEKQRLDKTRNYCANCKHADTDIDQQPCCLCQKHKYGRYSQWESKT